MGPSTRHHPPPSPPSNTSPTSPTWAEVARGEQEGRSHPPPSGGSSVTHSTPAPPRRVRTSPTPAPSAHTQFEAWLRCREEGHPAKLVLETDGVSEEVNLWFRRPTASTVHTACDKGTPSQRRRIRPERERRRRRLRAERRKAARYNLPPTSVEATARTANVPVPQAECLGDPAPSAGSPPAKRPRTRAAARSGCRLDLPTPEKSR